jgi:PKHD-type hydroxylase
MELEHNYIYIKSALTKENCNQIIQLGEDRIAEYKKLGIKTHGITAGGAEKQNKPEAKPLNGDVFEGKKESEYYIRDSEVAWLTDNWIYDLVMPHVNTANKISGWNFDVQSTESFQFTKYGLNQFYGWHSDGSGCHKSAYKRHYPGVNGQGLSVTKGHTAEPMNVGLVRKLSVTINLSEPGDYDGGLLNFDYGPHCTNGDRYKECTEIKPQGSIIVFPSFLHHQVTPVTKGLRYSLVLWVTGRPFK